MGKIAEAGAGKAVDKARVAANQRRARAADSLAQVAASLRAGMARAEGLRLCCTVPEDVDGNCIFPSPQRGEGWGKGSRVEFHPLPGPPPSRLRECK